MTDHVYFLRQRGVEGLVKIGCSRDPRGRINCIAPWSPFPLEVAAAMPGDYDLERRFHALFANDHVGREWFKASPALLAVIEEINAGIFDVETLPEPKALRTRRGARPKSCHLFTQYDDGSVASVRLQPVMIPALISTAWRGTMADPAVEEAA